MGAPKRGGGGLGRDRIIKGIIKVSVTELKNMRIQVLKES